MPATLLFVDIDLLSLLSPVSLFFVIHLHLLSPDIRCNSFLISCLFILSPHLSSFAFHFFFNFSLAVSFFPTKEHHRNHLISPQHPLIFSGFLFLLTFPSDDTFNLLVYLFPLPLSYPLVMFLFSIPSSIPLSPPIIMARSSFVLLLIYLSFSPLSGLWTWLVHCFWAEFPTCRTTSPSAPGSLSAAWRSSTLTASRWTWPDLLLTMERSLVSSANHSLRTFTLSSDAIWPQGP